MVYHNNITCVEFLGFLGLHNMTKVLLFSFLSIIYFVIVSGNLLVILLVFVSKNLWSPMYFFITQLSLLDVLLTTDILPNLLHIIVLSDGCTMSFAGCIVQFSFFATAEVSEGLLLTLMAYDRYLAVCKPLHYGAIMTRMLCIQLVILVWVLGFQIMLVNSISMCTLYYCGPNIINHFYCDLEPILKLSCSDTSWIHTQTIIIAFFCMIAPFTLILISYIYIALTIMKIPSATGRHKTFITCSSHLTVVSIFYGAIMIVYIFPARGQLYKLHKFLSLCYTVITPLINPIIYTFRNKDFKEAFEKIRSKPS